MIKWTDQLDGSRVRVTTGIRIVDRTRRPVDSVVEHLVTWREDSGTVVILGLDKACRPIALTAL
jgi:hypothetical protein